MPEKKFFNRAIDNITKHGDTDIFPLPIENHILFDKKAEVVTLLVDIDKNFVDRIAKYPPSNYSALAPVGYTGFRWATQLDPIWNAYFLGLVLSIADHIEKARLPKKDRIVFSYRYEWKENSAELFDKKYNWRAFMDRSVALAKKSKFVVTCDISEFYPRLNHHRLDNAIEQLKLAGDQQKKIMSFLSNFSGTYSFGIPVGGPAARLLSELLLNQVDRLLRLEGIKFCRYADDYHLFCNDYQSAFKSLVFLSEKLIQNQGLQLQKAKTRIMSGQEFVATAPTNLSDSKQKDAAGTPISQQLMNLTLRFDPYSATAVEDYEALKSEIKRFDILSLLKAELAKSRIHISLSKKIVSAIRYIDSTQRDEAALSLLTNEELLYPIYSQVLLVAKTLFMEMSPEPQASAMRHVRNLLQRNSYVMQSDLNLAYAVRFVSLVHSPENEEVLNNVYRDTASSLIRRDVILAMARWKAWYWLSNVRGNFRTFSPAERRAFLIASFVLNDEGQHWRRHIARELSPFEIIVKDWAAERTKSQGWSVPL